MSDAILKELQEFDNQIEEVIFSCDCTARNKQRSQTVDGLLYMVKRKSEPTFQIILKPAWPVVTGSELCGFRLEKSFDKIGRFEEVEPKFLLPSQSGFVVCFNNLEDSTRAAECIRGLVYPSSRTVRITEITEVISEDEEIPREEHRASGVSSGGITGQNVDSIPIDIEPENDPQIFDRKVYLQNTRVIVAMIAVLLATVVLTVGLNPPSSIGSFTMKIIFQITFWIAAVFSLAALLLLGIVTPTSFHMQSRVLGFAYISIEIAMVCVVVAFGATTLSMENNLFSIIVGGTIGLIGVIVFLYFTSTTVRRFIFHVTGFSLTQSGDDSPYSVPRF